jgi:hypothetical protein
MSAFKTLRTYPTKGSLLRYVGMNRIRFISMTMFLSLDVVKLMKSK